MAAPSSQPRTDNARLYEAMVAPVSADRTGDALVNALAVACQAANEVEDPNSAAPADEDALAAAHRGVWDAAQNLRLHQGGGGSGGDADDNAKPVSRGELERKEQALFRELKKWAQQAAGPNALKKIDFGASGIAPGGGGASSEGDGSNATDAGFGLWAAADLPAGTEYLRIPRTLMMTISSARETLGEWSRTDALSQGVPAALLALHVLHQRQTLKSRWEPYLRMLPKTFDLALFWTPDEVMALPAGFLRASCRRLIRQSLQHYVYYRVQMAKLGESAPVPAAKFLVEDFLWAMAVVMSRQNEIPEKDGEKDGKKVGKEGEKDGKKAATRMELALIPVWDLSNHKSSGAMSTGFDERVDSVVAMVDSDLTRGDEICMFYGHRPNYQLLLWQGFTVADNPFDSYPISLPLSPPSPSSSSSSSASSSSSSSSSDGTKSENSSNSNSVGLARAKAALLSRFGVDARRLQLPLNVHVPGDKPHTVAEHGVFLTVRTAARIAVMSQAELKEHGLATAEVLPARLSGGSAEAIEARAVALLRAQVEAELALVSPAIAIAIPSAAEVGARSVARRTQAHAIANCAVRILERVLLALDMKVVLPVSPPAHVPARREMGKPAPKPKHGGGGRKKGGKGRGKRR
jgi:hypothetical protein